MGSLGDRMKNYEQAYKIVLPERLPIIMRLDGRNFHTFTRKAEKPFDERIMGIVESAALAVAKEIQGVRFGYVQSDEMSFFIYPWNRPDSQAWFGNELQKMVSLSAAIASSAGLEAMVDWGYMYGSTPIFDSRTFVLPMHEVPNYFIWRQQDWARNSLNMLCDAHFSHNQLHDKDSSQRHEMLHGIDINWANLPNHLKNGTAIIYDEGKWVANKEMPILTETGGRPWFWKQTLLPTNRTFAQDLYSE